MKKRTNKQLDQVKFTPNPGAIYMLTGSWPSEIEENVKKHCVVTPAKVFRTKSRGE